MRLRGDFSLPNPHIDKSGFYVCVIDDTILKLSKETYDSLLKDHKITLKELYRSIHSMIEEEIRITNENWAKEIAKAKCEVSLAF